MPGTGPDGGIHAGSGGFGSARLGFVLTNGGPTATRFPLAPKTVPGGGARSGGGWKFSGNNTSGSDGRVGTRGAVKQLGPLSPAYCGQSARV